RYVRVDMSSVVKLQFITAQKELPFIEFIKKGVLRHSELGNYAVVHKFPVCGSLRMSDTKMY
ncbi:MAG: hypothetical protein SNG10_06725, partial [Rikenellaceae bacterium]